MDLAGFISGLALGYGAAVPIGPVNVEMARRTIKGGFRAGFALGCGAVTIDVVYLLVLVLCAQKISFNRHSIYMNMLGVCGAVLLFYLAYGCLKSAYKPVELKLDTTTNARSHYLSGLLMTSLNPMTLVFWFVIVPATGMNGGDHLSPSAAHGLTSSVSTKCIGVFLAAISWVLLFTSLLSWIRSKNDPAQKLRGMRICDLVGGVLLFSFALRTIWRIAVQYL